MTMRPISTRCIALTCALATAAPMCAQAAGPGGASADWRAALAYRSSALNRIHGLDASTPAAPQPVSDGSFDWAAAGVGAAGGVLIAGSVLVGGGRVRRQRTLRGRELTSQGTD